MEDLIIFVATHKKFEQKLPSYYKPILVGSYNKKINDYIRDDMGKKQISNKNQNYCELTGMYWIWQNINIEYVGLCHYRRYFVTRYKKILKKEKILKFLKSNDIILPKKWYTNKSIYEHYREKHNIKDLENCKKIIQENYPDYLESFDRIMNGHGMYTCNMFITRKKIYDEYSEWLFDIMTKLEKITDVSKYDDYQKRIYGFLSERLFNVWIDYKKLKVKEENIWLTQNTRMQEYKRNIQEYRRKLLYR